MSLVQNGKSNFSEISAVDKKRTVLLLAIKPTRQPSTFSQAFQADIKFVYLPALV